MELGRRRAQTRRMHDADDAYARRIQGVQANVDWTRRPKIAIANARTLSPTPLAPLKALYFKDNEQKKSQLVLRVRGLSRTP